MMQNIDDFYPCEICGQDNWQIDYTGPVRDGSFGDLTDDTAKIATCGGCGAGRLDEGHCREDDVYRDRNYRDLIKETAGANGFFAEHDVLQPPILEQLQPHSMRGKIVADVGCAAGGFLDHISGLTREELAIDPCQDYHASLADRGYKVYSHVADAAAEQAGRVDWAFSLSVIEHTSNPRQFLEDIGKLLAPDGRLMISTPNRRDILIDLLPDDYAKFFYRTLHRWYFDTSSIEACAKLAGLEVVEIKMNQRFGLSNAFHWLRDRRPKGDHPISDVNFELLDQLWRGCLEAEGIGDYLYVFLRRA